MEVAKPYNEDSILPTLIPQQREDYLVHKSAINSMLAKYPDEDPAMFHDHLTMWLDAAKNVNAKTMTSDGLPVDRVYLEKQMQIAKKEFSDNFDAKYPIRPKDSMSEEQKAAVEKNMRSQKRLRREIEGDGLLTSVYDEEKGGFQWSKITLGGLGGGLGLLMGLAISSAAGGGWLGMLAMVIMGGAGMMFGSQIADQYEKQGAKSAEPAGTAPAKEREAGVSREPEVSTGTSRSTKTEAETSRKPTTVPGDNPVYTPEETLFVNPHQHPFIPLKRDRNGTIVPDKNNPQMFIDGVYSTDASGNVVFKVENARLFVGNQNKLVGIDKEITFAANKDGAINFSTPASRQALSSVSAEVKKILVDEQAKITPDTQERTRKLEVYESFINADILKPSIAPQAPERSAAPAATEASAKTEAPKTNAAPKTETPPKEAAAPENKPVSTPDALVPRKPGVPVYSTAPTSAPAIDDAPAKNDDLPSKFGAPARQSSSPVTPPPATGMIPDAVFEAHLKEANEKRASEAAKKALKKESPSPTPSSEVPMIDPASRKDRLMKELADWAMNHDSKLVIRDQSEPKPMALRPGGTKMTGRTIDMQYLGSNADNEPSTRSFTATLIGNDLYLKTFRLKEKGVEKELSFPNQGSIVRNVEVNSDGSLKADKLLLNEDFQNVIKTMNYMDSGYKNKFDHEYVSAPLATPKGDNALIQTGKGPTAAV